MIQIMVIEIFNLKKHLNEFFSLVRAQQLDLELITMLGIQLSQEHNDLKYELQVTEILRRKKKEILNFFVIG